jgi:hypothetical protein
MQVREDSKWVDIGLEQLDIGGRFADALARPASTPGTL